MCAILTTFHNIEYKYNTKQPSNCNLRKQPFANNTKKSKFPHDDQIQYKIFINNTYPDLRKAGDNIYDIMQLVLTQIFHISIVSRELNFFINTYKKSHFSYHFYVFGCMQLHVFDPFLT